MAILLFCAGLLVGLVIAWLILAFLICVTIKRKKRAAAKPQGHADDIPYTLVTLVLCASYFPLLAPWIFRARA